MIKSNHSLNHRIIIVGNCKRDCQPIHKGGGGAGVTLQVTSSGVLTSSFLTSHSRFIDFIRYSLIRTYLHRLTQSPCCLCSCTCTMARVNSHVRLEAYSHRNQGETRDSSHMALERRQRGSTVHDFLIPDFLLQQRTCDTLRLS